MFWQPAGRQCSTHPLRERRPAVRPLHALAPRSPLAINRKSFCTTSAGAPTAPSNPDDASIE